MILSLTGCENKVKQCQFSKKYCYLGSDHLIVPKGLVWGEIGVVDGFYFRNECCSFM